MAPPPPASVVCVIWVALGNNEPGSEAELKQLLEASREARLPRPEDGFFEPESNSFGFRFKAEVQEAASAQAALFYYLAPFRRWPMPQLTRITFLAGDSTRSVNHGSTRTAGDVDRCVTDREILDHLCRHGRDLRSISGFRGKLSADGVKRRMRDARAVLLAESAGQPIVVRDLLREARESPLEPLRAAAIDSAVDPALMAAFELLRWVRPRNGPLPGRRDLLGLVLPAADGGLVSYPWLDEITRVNAKAVFGRGNVQSNPEKAAIAKIGGRNVGDLRVEIMSERYIPVEELTDPARELKLRRPLKDYDLAIRLDVGVVEDSQLEEVRDEFDRRFGTGVFGVVVNALAA